MRKTLFATAALALVAAVPAHAQFTAAPEFELPKADLIVEDATIYTPGGWATSMAISHGAIIAIGDAQAVEAHRGASTQTLDLDGKLVIPGLHDMHVHPSGGGLAQFRCMVPQGSNAQQSLDFIAGCVAKAPPGEWIDGGGYQNDSFGNTPPTKELLDRVSPNNPVLLRDISGHSAWANSMALRIAGVNANTPDPEGGIIERAAGGEPTGILRESASGLVSVHVPAPSEERLRAALKWALDDMLSYGITAFDDAGVFRATAEAYASLADAGELKQRARGCLWGSDEELVAQRMLYARDRFSPSCVKLVLDGVPTDGHTAAMVDPYQPMHGAHEVDSIRERGLLLIQQDQLNEQVARLDRDGLTVKFHAAGDGAVRAGLNAIEHARQQNGVGGALHNVGHNSFVQMEDLQRGARIGAAFEFSPYIWYTSPIIADIRKAVGEERMKRWIPIKDALDAGALVVPGSDWNVVPTVNPWIAIETLVTRQVPGGGGEVLGAQERITLEQAIDVFTRQSARQMNFDHATGTLEQGKLADFIVLDRNIFTIPITDVHNTQVVMTYIDGEKVFDSAAK
ncbi:amidohydrolase [Altericroceibacterium xinjiangense]|uniref:amidohydrolase n=1 Tax=Altericroceibacterium xinjiangense TaxID=762261 RepID=UPI000F7F323E|nr:amidohydrolase [Altericroceibacterium xinjiangense]